MTKEKFLNRVLFAGTVLLVVVGSHWDWPMAVTTVLVALFM